MTVTPSSRSLRITPSSRSTSSSGSDTVGSSMISELHVADERPADHHEPLLRPARAPARPAEVGGQAEAFGDRLRLPADLAPAHASARRRVVADEHVLGRRQRGRERQLLRHDLDPALTAFTGEEWASTLPCPEELARRRAGRCPPTIFISVDLPAPFSPTSPRISPRRTSNETSSSARTPGEHLDEVDALRASSSARRGRPRRRLRSIAREPWPLGAQPCQVGAVDGGRIDVFYFARRKSNGRLVKYVRRGRSWEMGRRRLMPALAVAGLAMAILAASAGGASRSAAKAPPKITVGFLQILGASPSAQRNENQFKRAAKVLGWKVNVVDAQGDPAKMASGIQSFVTQKVDAIVTIAVAPAAAQQALTAAKTAGIPAITIAGPNPDPNQLYAAQIAPNDSALGALSAQHLCDTLGKGAKIVAQFFPPLDALARRDTVAQAVFAHCGVKIVATPPGRLRERRRRLDQVDARHAPREPDRNRRLGRPGLRVRGRRQRRSTSSACRRR